MKNEPSPRVAGGAVPMAKQSHHAQTKLQQVIGDENIDDLSQSTSEIATTNKSAEKKSLIRYRS